MKTFYDSVVYCGHILSVDVEPAAAGRATEAAIIKATQRCAT